MPLLVGAVAPVPTETPTAGSGRPRITWVAPDGTEWPLTASSGLGWQLMRGVRGLGMGDVALTVDPQPGGGEAVRHKHRMPRRVTLPIRIGGSTVLEQLRRSEDLANAFGQTDLPGAAAGRLRYQRPDGSTRELIDCWYEGGFDGQRGHGHVADLVVVTLYCGDPLWYAVEPVELTRRYSAGGTPYLTKWPIVSSSRLLGSSTVHNSGPVEAWPTVTVTGPATYITATNDRTGESWELDPSTVGLENAGPLLAGQTVTVTTRPGSVRGPAGENWSGGLNWPDAQLWPVLPGPNAVTLTLSGAGEGSQITFSFKPRHRTA